MVKRLASSRKLTVWFEMAVTIPMDSLEKEVGKHTKDSARTILVLDRMFSEENKML